MLLPPPKKKKSPFKIVHFPCLNDFSKAVNTLHKIFCASTLFEMHYLYITFIFIMLQAGIINDEIMRKVPQRGRKRFVSEGDGGLVKDSLAW